MLQKKNNNYLGAISIFNGSISVAWVDVSTGVFKSRLIGKENNSNLKHDVTIDTYNDHRMAMSFAPLSLLTPININNPEVVTKSYLNFWNDLESLGFDISKNK